MDKKSLRKRKKGTKNKGGAPQRKGVIEGWEEREREKKRTEKKYWNKKTNKREKEQKGEKL